MREVGYFVLCRGRARENAVRERGGVVYKQEQVSISRLDLDLVSLLIKYYTA